MLKQGLLLLCLLTLSGCAQVPESKYDERDPLQNVNRPIYDFNMDVLDTSY
jgi:phospholipid-binding lipoprotein MlaA